MVEQPINRPNNWLTDTAIPWGTLIALLMNYVPDPPSGKIESRAAEQCGRSIDIATAHKLDSEKRMKDCQYKELKTNIVYCKTDTSIQQ